LVASFLNFNQFAYRDKEVVGVFVRFSCAASENDDEVPASYADDISALADSPAKLQLLIDHMARHVTWEWHTQ
jgi:hypothetical protein